MYDTYDYFIEENYDKKFNNLMNSFDLFRAFFIKYFQTRNEEDKQKAIKYIKITKQADKEFLLSSLNACYKEARQEAISLQIL